MIFTAELDSDNFTDACKIFSEMNHLITLSYRLDCDTFVLYKDDIRIEKHTSQ